MQQAPQTHSVTVENLHLFLFILNKNQTFFFFQSLVIVEILQEEDQAGRAKGLPK